MFTNFRIIDTFIFNNGAIDEEAIKALSILSNKRAILKNFLNWNAKFFFS
jgi:hypothetical protein